LIEIAKNLPVEINLIILGSGPEEKKIEDLATLQKNIHFLGYQTKDQTISLIRGSDILIQPSLNEGISSTILEAMACKTIIIASNVGGNKELIENNINGYLVESNNVESFTNKIDNVFENTELKQSIVDQAFKTVKNYDWNQVGKIYLKIYESILNSPE